ncbi:MAG: hypothetical protein QNJ63_15370 [Calothrix sp. MO_192.B10]|nr:hypothetical protein [Calothrix sp. MO_192.B10]
MKKTHAIAFSSVMAMSALVVTANPFNFNSAWKIAAEITEKSQKVLSVSIPRQGNPLTCHPDYCGICDPWC